MHLIWPVGLNVMTPRMIPSSRVKNPYLDAWFPASMNNPMLFSALLFSSLTHKRARDEEPANRLYRRRRFPTVTMPAGDYHESEPGTQTVSQCDSRRNDSLCTHYDRVSGHTARSTMEGRVCIYAAPTGSAVAEYPWSQDA
jgi:hypothetical protein